MMLARVPSTMLARAPEQTQKIKQAYQRLAAQHEWPALAEDAEPPDGLKSRVAYFFAANLRFQDALRAKWRSSRKRCTAASLYPADSAAASSASKTLDSA